MQIEGPLKFSIVNFDDSDDREVHVNFKEEFLQLTQEQQASQFTEHVSSLRSQADSLQDDSQQKIGMLFVLQFLEELEPKIQSGDIPLNETIIVKVMEESPIKKMISDLQIN